MLGAIFDLARPLLFALDPEHAHELTLKSLEAGLYPRPQAADDARLSVSLWGARFPNPLGIAAGFDKDARVPSAVLGMGFGFSEIGTVTPRPQDGNPRPRVFRLTGDRALINRLGFNNQGHAAALDRLRRQGSHAGIVGVNVGANKDTSDRAGDYVEGVRRFYDVASYFTINVSSPNTPGLRDLQAPAALDDLLGRVLAARQELVDAGKPRRPLVVKVAPDVAEEDLGPTVEVLLARGIDGIAVSNTTLARTGIADAALAREAGGVSGRPIFHRSTVMLARVYQLTQGRIPLIGVGGIDSGAAALGKIRAGANLIQLYSAMVFRGLGLLTEIKAALVHALDRGEAEKLADLVGIDAAAMTAARWPD